MIVKSVFIYVIIRIGIGALMHGFIPTGFLNNTSIKDNPFVDVAVVLGVPMYSNAAGVLPVFKYWFKKVTLGTASIYDGCSGGSLCQKRCF